MAVSRKSWVTLLLRSSEQAAGRSTILWRLANAAMDFRPPRYQGVLKWVGGENRLQVCRKRKSPVLLPPAAQEALKPNVSHAPSEAACGREYVGLGEHFERICAADEREETRGVV